MSNELKWTHIHIPTATQCVIIRQIANRAQINRGELSNPFPWVPLSELKPIGVGYTAGELRVPLFAACPDTRQIVRPNGTVLGTVSVNQIDAFLAELNSLAGHV